VYFTKRIHSANASQTAAEPLFKKFAEVAIGKTICNMNKCRFFAHFLWEQCFIPLKDLLPLTGTTVHSNDIMEKCTKKI
jgi:hypothetical protein